MLQGKVRWRLTFVVLVLAIVAAACGGGEAATPDENGVIVVELDEFQFSPGDIKVKVGDTVTIRLNNVGSKPHEWMIGRTVDMDEGFPSGFHENFFDDMMGLEVMPMDAAMGMPDMEMDMDSTDTTMADMEDDMGHGFMIMREPGEEATVTFTVTEDQIGEWEMGCFEEDGAHYDDGMKGTFIVEA